MNPGKRRGFSASTGERGDTRTGWLGGRSGANPSPGRNSLLSGKIQGIARFCTRLSSLRRVSMPEIPRVSAGNSLSRRTGNFRIVTGKNLARSGKFGCRSGKTLADWRRPPPSTHLVFAPASAVPSGRCQTSRRSVGRAARGEDGRLKMSLVDAHVVAKPTLQHGARMVGFRSRLSWRSASLRPGQSATTRPALQRAAGEEGGGRGAVVGAIVAVDVRGAAELSDQRDDGVGPRLAHVGFDRGDRAVEGNTATSGPCGGHDGRGEGRRDLDGCPLYPWRCPLDC